jgi:hypothetical protein
MSTNYVSTRLKTFASKRFRDIFANRSNTEVGFIFIGRSLEYANVQSIDSITDTVKDEKTIWDNMIVAKQIEPGDVELVIPRYNWEDNVTYKQFDDMSYTSDMAEPDLENDIRAFYVINSEGNVYKCLSNNASANSTIEPTGNYTSSNGYITTPDDYVWKYMYNIEASNRFLTNTWMPVPFNIPLTYTPDYDMDFSSLIDGAINLIVVDDGGSGYYHKTHTYNYSNGQSYLVTSDIANVSVGMSVTGNGILDGVTYVSSIDTDTNRVFLSYPTIGSGNTFTTLTRVVIEGDGTDATASVVLENDTIKKINILSSGSDYSRANVILYGTSNDAVVRAVLPPKHGHGFAPALELFCKAVIVVKRIGDIDSTDSGVVPTDISFRQYGMLMSPHLYNSEIQVSYNVTNNIVSQTTDVVVADGLPYEQNEFVYQGVSLQDSNFSGLVISQTDTILKLTNVKGTPDIGTLLKGNTVSRPVVSYTLPRFEPYSGHIIYVNNVSAIERTEGQSEEIKIIIKC